eukprot:Skav227839  [mRNA]  locus=scaffold752:9250:12280:- [translate_table: standard]
MAEASSKWRSSVSGERTALHWAAEKGYPNLVEQLLDAGAVVNALAKGGLTSLHLAATAGNSSVAELLTAARAELETKTKWDGRNLKIWNCQAYVSFQCQTALHCAALKGNLKTLEVLLAAGAFPDATDRDGSLLKGESGSNLLLAAEKGKVRALRHFLGAHPVKEDMERSNALLAVAALNGHANVVAVLLTARASLEAQNKQGLGLGFAHGVVQDVAHCL